MAKSHFSFKQFTVYQDRCAMKVCTDACIFGASIELPPQAHVLDIGGGTGLLSLMVAQRFSESHFWSVEIDEEAAQQASENVEKSPFKEQITVVHSSIQHFQATENQHFTTIISNPPFFQNALLSPNETVNKAHHNQSLSFEELIESVLRLLAPNGQFWLLLPPPEMQYFQQLAQKSGLFLQSKTDVRHDAQKPLLRTIAVFGRTPIPTIQSKELAIYAAETSRYSDDFRELLKDYYLIF